ncbi:MAG: hypothetical protein WCB93_03280 [Gallionella sp.]
MSDTLPPSPSSIIQRKVAIAARFGTFMEWHDFLKFASLTTCINALLVVPG